MSGDGQGASYKDIIANGDYINRAIFTQAEFESGLCRLTQHDLIIEVYDKFYPSPKALELLDKAKNNGAVSVKDVRTSIESMVGAIPYEKMQIDTGICSYKGYSPEKFAEAISEYKQEFNEYFSR
jgi:hypothetical protein